MKIKNILVSGLAASVLVISGCTAPATTTDNPATSVTVSGSIIDGYIQYATVFIDKNENSRIDEGEPYTLSDENGNFAFDAAALEGVDLTKNVQIVSMFGWDSVTNKPYTGKMASLVEPSSYTGSDTAKTSAVAITPLTSYVAASVRGGETVASASAKVKAAFGLTDADVDNVLTTNPLKLTTSTKTKVLEATQKIQKIMEVVQASIIAADANSSDDSSVYAMDALAQVINADASLNFSDVNSSDNTTHTSMETTLTGVVAQINTANNINVEANTTILAQTMLDTLNSVQVSIDEIDAAILADTTSTNLSLDELLASADSNFSTALASLQTEASDVIATNVELVDAIDALVADSLAAASVNSVFADKIRDIFASQVDANGTDAKNMVASLRDTYYGVTGSNNFGAIELNNTATFAGKQADVIEKKIIPKAAAFVGKMETSASALMSSASAFNSDVMNDFGGEIMAIATRMQNIGTVIEDSNGTSVSTTTADGDLVALTVVRTDVNASFTEFNGTVTITKTGGTSISADVFVTEQNMTDEFNNTNTRMKDIVVNFTPTATLADVNYTLTIDSFSFDTTVQTYALKAHGSINGANGSTATLTNLEIATGGFGPDTDVDFNVIGDTKVLLDGTITANNRSLTGKMNIDFIDPAKDYIVGQYEDVNATLLVEGNITVGLDKANVNKFATQLEQDRNRFRSDVFKKSDGTLDIVVSEQWDWISGTMVEDDSTGTFRAEYEHNHSVVLSDSTQYTCNTREYNEGTFTTYTDSHGNTYTNHNYQNWGIISETCNATGVGYLWGNYIVNATLADGTTGVLQHEWFMNGYDVNGYEIWNDRWSISLADSNSDVNITDMTLVNTGAAITSISVATMNPYSGINADIAFTGKITHGQNIVQATLKAGNNGGNLSVALQNALVTDGVSKIEVAQVIASAYVVNDNAPNSAQASLTGAKFVVNDANGTELKVTASLQVTFTGQEVIRNGGGFYNTYTSTEPTEISGVFAGTYSLIDGVGSSAFSGTAAVRTGWAQVTYTDESNKSYNSTDIVEVNATVSGRLEHNGYAPFGIESSINYKDNFMDIKALYTKGSIDGSYYIALKVSGSTAEGSLGPVVHVKDSNGVVIDIDTEQNTMSVKDVSSNKLANINTSTGAITYLLDDETTPLSTETLY